jgi:predicted DNA-binding transcriptional regulator AlpA
MSESVSEPDYLDCQAVADRANVTRKTIWERLSRGQIPEPDLVWMRHPLWLPETIDEWLKMKNKHRKTARVKRSKRVKQPDSARTRARPPRVAKASRNGASEKPLVSAVSEQIAKQIASVLRNDGFYCTTADVMELGSSTGEQDHEREILRQRVQAKIRGLKRKPV